MTPRVLLADDSELMRYAISRLLVEEGSTEIVGQARWFAETLQLATALKPNVLLLEVHMNDEHEYPPESVKAQLAGKAGCVLAISVWQDDEAKSLAARLGARALLDKAKLYSDLIPAINKHCGDAGAEWTC